MMGIDPAIGALNELERVHRDLAKIGERLDDARRRELIQLRRASSDATAEVGRLAEPLFADHPADHAEFRRLYSAMRSAVALHQADWPAVRLNEIDQRYHQSGQNVRAANHAFVTWLRNHLNAMKN